MSRLNVRPAVVVLVAVALVGSVLAGGVVAQEGTPTAEEEEPMDETPTDGEEQEETPTDGEEQEETPTDGEEQEETPMEEPAEPEESYVRVLHASPDAPAVDVYVENETFLTNFSFGNVSDYVVLSPGNYSLTITAAGDREAVVFDGTVSLEPGARTIAAAGELRPNTATEFELVSWADDATQPAEDEAAVSVVHLSPDAPAVDVTTADGAVLAENVSYPTATNYTTVPAGNYTAQVRAAAPENDGPVVAEVDVSLEGETAYSALALGYLEPAENASLEQPFQVSLVEDATTVTENGTATVLLPLDDEMMDEPTPTEEAEEEPETTPTEEAEEEPETTPTDAGMTETAAEG
jgi:hypothetical protein